MAHCPHCVPTPPAASLSAVPRPHQLQLCAISLSFSQPLCFLFYPEGNVTWNSPCEGTGSIHHSTSGRTDYSKTALKKIKPSHIFALIKHISRSECWNTACTWELLHQIKTPGSGQKQRADLLATWAASPDGFGLTSLGTRARTGGTMKPKGHLSLRLNCINLFCWYKNKQDF